MELRPYDMYTHRESIHIDAPPERVFAIVGDLATRRSGPVPDR